MGSNSAEEDASGNEILDEFELKVRRPFLNGFATQQCAARSTAKDSAAPIRLLTAKNAGDEPYLSYSSFIETTLKRNSDILKLHPELRQRKSRN